MSRPKGGKNKEWSKEQKLEIITPIIDGLKSSHDVCLFYDNVLIVNFRKCPNNKYHDIISIGGINHEESRIKNNGTNKIRNNKKSSRQ